MNSGIYQTRNTVNNKIYIGSTNNLEKRKYDHFHALSKKKHSNSHLQYSFDLYKEESFEFSILKKCEVSELLLWEQYYFDTILFAKEFIDSNEKDKRFEELSYNINPLAERIFYTQKLRKKVSILATNRIRTVHSEQTKQKMSFSAKNRTEEVKENIRKGLIGKTRSAEIREKMKRVWVLRKLKKLV